MSWKWINTVMRVNSLVQKVSNTYHALQFVADAGIDCDYGIYHYTVYGIV